MVPSIEQVTDGYSEVVRRAAITNDDDYKQKFGRIARNCEKGRGGRDELVVMVL